MPNIDQNMLIEIILESPATGMMNEIKAWQPGHWINLEGHAVPQQIFQHVSPSLYIDILVNDTVDVVDHFLTEMVNQE